MPVHRKGDGALGYLREGVLIGPAVRVTGAPVDTTKGSAVSSGSPAAVGLAKTSVPRAGKRSPMPVLLVAVSHVLALPLCSTPTASSRIATWCTTDYAAARCDRVTAGISVQKRRRGRRARLTRRAATRAPRAKTAAKTYRPLDFVSLLVASTTMPSRHNTITKPMPRPSTAFDSRTIGIHTGTYSAHHVPTRALPTWAREDPAEGTSGSSWAP